MYYLRTHRLQWGIYGPEEGSYTGVRFDRSGLTASLAMDGVECCGPWYGTHDPAAHDAACPVWLYNAAYSGVSHPNRSLGFGI